MDAQMADRTLAEIVNVDPASAAIFETVGLDYCCGGRRSLRNACATAGLDPAVVQAMLHDARPAPDDGWSAMDVAELVDHVETTHHAYLHAELPLLEALLDKVTAAHGVRHPELEGIGVAYRALRDDLEPHLAKEERVLFPMIRSLATSGELPAFHCGSLRNPISVMVAEHEQTGELLGALRRHTGGYQAPPDGCGSYRNLFARLSALEADVHLHVHKENNRLFPAVVALEAGRAEPDA
jgi:regulator of cell morphogenesis and NO signaling